ncbi:MAG TPA: hypothetical protein PLC65_03495, partial [Bacteroidia bacterium]|nr:hypothetical protein [Bacteroidia bacterium]
LREAIAAIREGDGIIDMGEERLYMAALPYYLKAQAFNPNNDKVNFMIAVCYLSKNSHERTRAYEYVMKAYQLNPNVDKKIKFYLGAAYQLQSEWDKAITEFEAYKNTQKLDDAKLKKTLKHIDEC